MRLTSLLFFFLIFSGLHAQEYSTVWGNIGDAEKSLVTYDGDTAAEAVVLYDKGKSHFVSNQTGFDLVFERSTRIKILSESALEWAEIEIPIYQEGGIYEKAYDIVAYTYNFDDGKMQSTRLDINTVYEEKLNNSWAVKKFVMPKVKKGSIIEYQYKVSSQYIFNLEDWEFQWRIPVVYSEYEVRSIPFYVYTSLMQGNRPEDEKTAYTDTDKRKRSFGPINFHDRVYVYVKKDVPAFYDESYITSVDDYIIKIDFQLSKVYQPDGREKDIITTWKKMIEDLVKHENFGRYVKKSSKYCDKLLNKEELLTMSELTRFNEVLDYVKSNYSWNGYNRKYSGTSASKFIKLKTGNSADVNLFTIGLLQDLGIDAYPVISSTRSNGKVKHDYPFSHFFDYVLIGANLDGKTVLSDATEINSANYRIPQRCINDKGLVIKEDIEPLWLGLTSKVNSMLSKSFVVRFDEELNMNNSCVLMATEYNALYYRNNYADDEEGIIEKMADRGYDCIDTSLVIRNNDETKKPYILGFNFDQESERIQDKIYISPFFNEAVTEVPFKQEIRTYPVDMTYTKTKSFNTKIIIPDGYHVDFIPKKRTISTDVFDLHYNAQAVGRDVNIAFKYSFKKAIYSANEYDDIKYYFKEIVKKGNEKIVLSKDEILTVED